MLDGNKRRYRHTSGQFALQSFPRAHSMINCLKWRTLGFDQWQNPGGVQGALTSPFSKIIPSVTYDKIRLLTEEEKENRYKC